MPARRSDRSALRSLSGWLVKNDATRSTRFGYTRSKTMKSPTIMSFCWTRTFETPRETSARWSRSQRTKEFLSSTAVRSSGLRRTRHASHEPHNRSHPIVVDIRYGYHGGVFAVNDNRHPMQV